MNPEHKGLKIAGVVLHVLVAGMMLMAGSGKVFGFAPAEVVEGMAKHGLKDQMVLIGLGEMVAAILMLLPWTSPFGVLMTSGFWGGAICIHMAYQESYTFVAVLLVLTWIGGFLRGSVPLLALEPKATT